ncbi:MAG: hypothetical protein ACREIH_03600 [Nitrospiraceae bacterium]
MTRMSHALMILLLLVSPACYFGGTEEFRYNTYDEAKQAGALLGGGYLPMLLPKSALSISEKHNASTYQILMTFGFNEAERDEMIKNCHQVAVANVKSPGLKASWWPDDLKWRNFATSRYVYYYCSIDEGFLALTKGEAYFWRL